MWRDEAWHRQAGQVFKLGGLEMAEGAIARLALTQHFCHQPQDDHLANSFLS